MSRGGARGWALAAPALLWTGAFFVAPFALMAALSLARLEGREVVWGLWGGNFARLADPAIARSLAVSLEIAVLVTALSVLLAYPLAAILAFRVPPRWQRLALLVAVLPFWTSYVVRSYAWLVVLAREGPVNQALLGIGAIAEPLTLASTRLATVVGFVHFFTMLLALTIYASLAQLPPSYARAAADLGAGRVRTFWHVVLPLTLPGVATGAFLTFALTLGDYVTPQVLGGGNELTLPQVIMLQLGRRADFPLASALSLALMGVVTLAYLGTARWLRLDRL